MAELPSRPVPASRHASVSEAAAVARIVAGGVPASVGLRSVAGIAGGSPTGYGSGTTSRGGVDAGGVGDLAAATVAGSVPTKLVCSGSELPVAIGWRVSGLPALIVVWDLFSRGAA